MLGNIEYRQLAKMPLLMGQVAASVTEILPAKQIIDNMVAEAISTFRQRTAQISRI